MRIIAGQYRGRRLKAPRGAAVRPTSDGLRETLFNILRAHVPGARVLEGFAGTGAIGLEALSRGAAHVTFVERDRHALDALRQNIAACSAVEACAIIRDDFVGAGARHPAESYDLVIVDPPYDTDSYEPILLEAAARLAPGGVVVVEHSRRRPAPAATAHLSRQRVVTAGDSALAFYAADPGDLSGRRRD
jgi:16S rRNA (guanine(966)-N(2))-methyltransferase RsmD